MELHLADGVVTFEAYSPGRSRASIQRTYQLVYQSESNSLPMEV